MAYRVKLVRSLSGHPETHRATVRGLGLTRVGQSRVVADTKAIAGMIDKVKYLLEVEKVSEEAKPFGRRARAKAQSAAAKAAKAATPATPAAS